MTSATKAARAAAARVFDILDADTEKLDARRNGTLRQPLRGEVRFQRRIGDRSSMTQMIRLDAAAEQAADDRLMDEVVAFLQFASRRLLRHAR